MLGNSLDWPQNNSAAKINLGALFAALIPLLPEDFSFFQLGPIKLTEQEKRKGVIHPRNVYEDADACL